MSSIPIVHPPVNQLMSLQRYGIYINLIRFTLRRPNIF